jgi:hypothetical protein
MPSASQADLRAFRQFVIQQADRNPLSLSLEDVLDLRRCVIASVWAACPGGTGDASVL